MQGDVEGQHGLFHAEETLEKHKMAGTGDRKEFRQSLNNPKNQSLP